MELCYVILIIFIFYLFISTQGRVEESRNADDADHRRLQMKGIGLHAGFLQVSARRFCVKCLDELAIFVVPQVKIALEEI